MTNPFQLAEQRILAFVAMCDPDRAREFYRDTLGLALVPEELPFGLVFDVNGIIPLSVLDGSGYYSVDERFKRPK
jgi:catechol 2,3-dioxygenase-like lactoylglutathione lyase family enzyme